MEALVFEVRKMLITADSGKSRVRTTLFVYLLIASIIMGMYFRIYYTVPVIPGIGIFATGWNCEIV